MQGLMLSRCIRHHFCSSRTLSASDSVITKDYNDFAMILYKERLKEFNMQEDSSEFDDFVGWYINEDYLGYTIYDYINIYVDMNYPGDRLSGSPYFKGPVSVINSTGLDGRGVIKSVLAITVAYAFSLTQRKGTDSAL